MLPNVSKDSACFGIQWWLGWSSLRVMLIDAGNVWLLKLLKSALCNLICGVVLLVIMRRPISSENRLELKRLTFPNHD
ncbi:hypothetical protein L6452_05609 [Arctium lappa]|uniref:Uncharacterized protein n=1 Tax=Arctium lappa TaxID=4217 RepID=A0ACB9EGV3_ARCLA|nr:hypothetical protein L6452_05609 [Arctium lappa]